MPHASWNNDKRDLSFSERAWNSATWDTAPPADRIWRLASSEQRCQVDSWNILNIISVILHEKAPTCIIYLILASPSQMSHLTASLSVYLERSTEMLSLIVRERPGEASRMSILGDPRSELRGERLESRDREPLTMKKQWLCVNLSYFCQLASVSLCCLLHYLVIFCYTNKGYDKATWQILRSWTFSQVMSCHIAYCFAYLRVMTSFFTCWHECELSWPSSYLFRDRESRS